MIRKLTKEDKTIYIEMAKDFYASEAVYHNVPESHFTNTFHELMHSDTYAEAYIMEYKQTIAGYLLLAKTYSQEAGGHVLWIEEIYIKPEFRGKGLGHEFFSFIQNDLSRNVKRIRLEAEADNQKAIKLYKQLGYEDLPYLQLMMEL